ncbi:WD repeat-containing protein 55-like [Camellia sinensis]|uniref:WD repeat-containing protein 55-like n=1 Tax=Camellia sinensis TaxID=4442 RepID=UPI001035830F|nr:WD repeat-containing protein 55-like [Camellia sinensis]
MTQQDYLKHDATKGAAENALRVGWTTYGERELRVVPTKKYAAFLPGLAVDIWGRQEQLSHVACFLKLWLASDSIRLLGTSGDGTLSVCNLRSNKVQTRSEFSEDELLSVLIMKNGRKVICGTQTGTLLLYSWGFFKDCSDRFVDLSPNSIDALLKLDEDRVITGSENGLISLELATGKMISAQGGLYFLDVVPPTLPLSS